MDVEIDIDKLKKQVSSFVEDRVKGDDLIDTGKLLASINVTGNKEEITLHAEEYALYLNKKYNILPKAKDLKDMIKENYSIKGE